MSIEWYPGHIAKARKEILKSIKDVDIIIEILDARAPISTKTDFDFSDLKNKILFLFLNKSDLSDSNKNLIYKKYYQKKGYIVDCISSKNQNSKKSIEKLILNNCEPRINFLKSKGIINPVLKSIVIGLPNVGKSTFINNYVQKRISKVENRPGVTKANQWIKIDEKLLLLETPGITSKKFDNDKVGENLILIGSLDEKLSIKQDIVYNFLNYLKKEYKKLLISRYKLDDFDDNIDTIEIFDNIAFKTGCFKNKNIIDYEKASNIILDDFRSGRLGNITLDEE